MPTQLTDEEILEKYKKRREREDIYHAKWREANRQHLRDYQKMMYQKRKKQRLEEKREMFFTDI